MVKVEVHEPSRVYPTIMSENLSAIGVPQVDTLPDNLAKLSKL